MPTAWRIYGNDDISIPFMDSEDDHRTSQWSIAMRFGESAVFVHDHSMLTDRADDYERVTEVAQPG